MTDTKGIAIYPDKRIVERTFTGLSDYQAVVDGYIEAVTLSDGSTMWVNEEYAYRFTATDVNWIATDVCGLGGRPEFMFRQPILGPVVIIGPPDHNGDGTDVTAKAHRWVKRVANEAGGVWS